VKLVTIEAMIPELKGNNTEVARGKAGSVPLAMKRAMQNLMAKERIRRKQITSIKMTVTIVNVTATEKTVWFVEKLAEEIDRWEEHTEAGTFDKVVTAWDWIYEHFPPSQQPGYRVGRKKVPVETA
jgi:hypothetical protein